MGKIPLAFSSWLSKINFKIMYCNFCITVIIVIQLFPNVNWTRTITNLPWPEMHCWLIFTIILSILDWLVNMVNSHLIISFWNRLLLFFDTLLNPFWNHWLSLQSDWLSVVRFIHESHYFLHWIASYSQPMKMGQ